VTRHHSVRTGKKTGDRIPDRPLGAIVGRLNERLVVVD
jgi:hypothetical protein